MVEASVVSTNVDALVGFVVEAKAVARDVGASVAIGSTVEAVELGTAVVGDPVGELVASNSVPR